MGLPDRSPISYAVIIQTEVAITPLSGVKLAAETNLGLCGKPTLPGDRLCKPGMGGT